MKKSILIREVIINNAKIYYSHFESKIKLFVKSKTWSLLFLITEGWIKPATKKPSYPLIRSKIRVFD